MGGKLSREKKPERDDDDTDAADEEGDLFLTAAVVVAVAGSAASSVGVEFAGVFVDSRLGPRCDADGMGGDSAGASARGHAGEG